MKRKLGNWKVFWKLLIENLFWSAIDLYMIYSIVLGKGLFECVQCGITAKRKLRIKEHVKKLGPLHNDECAQCSQKMTSYNEYRDHVNNKHFGVWKFKCGFENCGKMLDEAKDCQNHTRIVHRQHELKPKKERIKKPKVSKESALIFCEQCGKHFTNKANYGYHIQSFHSKEALTEMCPHCNKSFIKVRLNKHIKNVHLETQCPQCGKIISGIGTLANHIKSVHTSMEDRPLKCETCGKGFFYQNCLDDHYNVHTGAKPYKCKYCPSAFASKGTHAMHQKGHLGIKRKFKNK